MAALFPEFNIELPAPQTDVEFVRGDRYGRGFSGGSRGSRRSHFVPKKEVCQMIVF
jgi:hypothetical protein